ncbi:efflux RND transporter permease subunit [Stutzerimonas stutzeri]|uniref:efflux RND transporter permease subunit n=1 Tax=Stutzerimonas stutzeri TaxID=316 RepID=UPI00265B355C|nr:MMPL family transporter [Stutzerimonas stutzeri]MCF6782305.1 MMPL family transporter [Stutzerimonas stutzeri]MCF6805373.1 MMPL family transporter [Stutzerimonas stutzeri]
MIERIAEFCIRRRVWVASVLLFLTLVLGWSALHIEVRTVFEDMLPSRHEYVQTHEKFKDTFGGSNMVTIMFEVQDGDIFQQPVLEKVREVTMGLREVSAVNPYQITSLASKKLKEVRASTSGIVSLPLMWPDLPETSAQLEELKQAVLRNPLVYGPYVSKDLQATLITVDFIDEQVDYGTVFHEIRDLIARVDDGSVNIRVVGDPILYGWVGHYLPETFQLVCAALLVTLVMLFILLRTWRGVLLPLLAGLVSASWALGICQLLGIHFEPLVIVVAMLITSRAVSHSVQIVNRFDDELELLPANADTSRTAARVALADLFRPGMLGVIADAACMAVVALSPIPMLQKLTVLACVWVLTLTVSAVILTPVMLSFIRRPHGMVHPLNCIPLLSRVLDLATKVCLSRARYVVLGGSLLLVASAGLYSLNLKIGDANPGSPILWPESDYNVDADAINSRFEGVDRMFVVLGEDDNRGLMKTSEALQAMNSFQRFMEAQPEVGGSVSLADVLPQINLSLREGNPRYLELGDNSAVNGSLVAMLDSVSEPGDMSRFADEQYANGAVTLMFRDRQGETIRTAVARIKEFVDQNPLSTGEWQLAGGLIGVMAAVNEIILASQIEAIALALLVLALICTAVYRSSVAGMVFMVPVIISNMMTFAFMTWQGIGMSINTVPVAALGIGLGVDYAFYIADRVKEEIALGKTPEEAIRISLSTAGMGVIVTASVLVFATLLWWVSSLRFQAEMGLLMAIWLSVSAFSALFVMPALLYVFRPRFVFGERKPAAEFVSSAPSLQMT